MTSRQDEIKARHEIFAAKHPGTEATVKEFDALVDAATADVPVLVAAVEAVLAIHERNDDGDCDTCGSSYCADFVPVEYPCPTVTAIQSALGEGEK